MISTSKLFFLIPDYTDHILTAGETRQYAETLEFSPVRRKDSGTYICQAENSIGLSNEEYTELDVQCECDSMYSITGCTKNSRKH